MPVSNTIIIDYGSGNLKSIQNMLRKIGEPSAISSNPDDILAAKRIILPGVGHFDHGMRELTNRGFVEAIQEVVKMEIPLLGICLGAQLLTRGSAEGTMPGLNIIPAETVAFDTSRLDSNLRIPHMGWAEVKPKGQSNLFDNIVGIPRFYFVHAYHLLIDNPEENELCSAGHGYEFPAGLYQGKVAGVQFHPEKSHRYGMQLLKNFIAKGI